MKDPRKCNNTIADRKHSATYTHRFAIDYTLGGSWFAPHTRTRLIDKISLFRKFVKNITFFCIEF